MTAGVRLPPRSGWGLLPVRWSAGIIGRDRRGALIGAGAVAGAAVPVTTNDGHARIDEGSTITVVLDESLEIW